MNRSQTVSIRLLRESKDPSDAVREGVQLSNWPTIDGAKIALDTIGGGAPAWSNFLDLSPAEKDSLTNSMAYGLVFVQAAGRWFAIAFGFGFVKLEPEAFEQDFGLRVVLNTVDPERLRSADIRTPDENTTSRRTQTARRSDQTAFSIDIEKDIVRELAGEPKDAGFAARVAGGDALSLTKKMGVLDLPQVCTEAFAAYGRTDYKTNFGWIDQIKHVRNDDLIGNLDAKLASAFKTAVISQTPDTLHLAYPIIYDPEKARYIRYRGYNSSTICSDLEIGGYIDDLRHCDVDNYEVDDLTRHKAHEVDDQGKDEGHSWKIKECAVFETTLNGSKYVLSGGRWYCIDATLAAEVEAFFKNISPYIMPPAEANDNEEKYNRRVATNNHGLLCLDRKLILPTGASYSIEACDFLSNEKALIHVKDQTSSSRLSHLFNQGTVSARVLKVDGTFRDRLRVTIGAQEKKLKLTGFGEIIPSSINHFKESDYLVVYAVLRSGSGKSSKRLPFFSLVTFRQAARDLRALGFRYAFAWIDKPKPTTMKVVRVRKQKPSK